MVKKPECYNIIGKVSKIDSWIEKISSLTNQDWNSFGNRKIFLDQKYSLTIPFFNLPDKENPVFEKNNENKKMLSLFKEELEECYSLIDKTYKNHEPKRIMLINLPSKKSVEPHIDSGYHLENIHRIHLPIITNSKVVFKVSNIMIPMEAGNLIEINNNVTHSVDNNSDTDRIHLVIDYGNKKDAYWC